MSFSRIDGAEVESRLVTISDIFAIRGDGSGSHVIFQRIRSELPLLEFGKGPGSVPHQPPHGKSHDENSQ
jgi:hypothetical protein